MVPVTLWLMQLLLKQTQATQLGRQRARDVAELVRVITGAAVKVKSGQSGQKSDQSADRSVETVRVGFEVAERRRVSWSRPHQTQTLLHLGDAAVHTLELIRQHAWRRVCQSRAKTSRTANGIVERIRVRLVLHIDWLRDNERGADDNDEKNHAFFKVK